MVGVDVVLLRKEEQKRLLKQTKWIEAEQHHAVDSTALAVLESSDSEEESSDSEVK